jgi:amino acid adenylation domain-containing protein
MKLTHKTFLHAFQKQVLRTPERIAISDATNANLTYTQTQKYANHVSHALTEIGVKRGDIVAVFLGRTAFFPVAAIGAFQAGAAYMPIDPRYPDSRIAFMLADSEAKVLITSHDLVSHSSGYAGKVLYVEDLWIEEEKTPEPIIDGEDMDYIIYTSGTTGNPKGAMNLHKGLMNISESYAEALNLTEDDTSGVYCSFAFDVSVMQIFPFLTYGAKVDIIPNEVILDMGALHNYINEHGITTMHLPPAVIKFFDQTCVHTTVKSVVGGGDWLTYGPGKNFLIYNIYGPAETSVFITTFLVEKKYDNYPFGKIFKNNVGYLVDENMNLVGKGEAGELCLAGIQVGAGYLKRPELTEKKFVKNPFSEEAGYERIYKTGDLCRQREDGNYEFVGRVDTQVKIRGFRVELGEIEATMRNYEGIKEAVCAAFEKEEKNEKYIIGYYTRDEEIEEKALKAYLSKTLPDYMIPVTFEKIEKVPLSENGKVDRKSLKSPVSYTGESQALSADFQAENPQEQMLADCLYEIFKNKNIDFEKTFSEAGGDSLGAIQLIALLIDKKYKLDIADIINPEHTLREIAYCLVPTTTSITKKAAGEWEKPAEWTFEQFNRVLEQYGRENIERIYDLTAFQTLFLTFTLTHPNAGTLHIQNSYTVQGHLDLELCRTAFTLIARKHPVLQSAIVHKNVPTFKQIILSNRELEIAVVADEALDRVVEQEFKRGFDFEEDNLLRIILVKNGERYTHIIISVHHVIIDGWSLGILMRDFAEIYRKLAKGTALTLLKEEVEAERKNTASHEDFVNYIKGLDHAAALSYFVKRLKGFNTQADLKHDYPNPQGNWDCLKEFLDVPQNIVEKVRAVARQYAVSPAAVYEGIFAFLLQQECESSNVVYNSLSNERGYPINGITNIVGAFVNFVIAKVTIDSSINTFAELFRLIQTQSRNDLKYSYVDFNEVEKRTSKCIFLFGYNQFLHHFDLTNGASASFDMEYHSAFADVFLTIEVTSSSSIRLRMEYNPYIHSLTSIRRFLNTYLLLLEYITVHADAKLSEARVPVLTYSR